MFSFIGNIGTPEIILILFIALIIFGPGKLPELGKAVGRTINEFKKASNDVKSQFEEVIKTDDQEKKES